MAAYDTNTTNSLIHLYRGELGRMVSYRIRLDTTTNWSIVTNAGITTVALGNTTIPHAVFLYAMFLTLFFLQLEARRFRVFEISHQRVRKLEHYFYQDMIGEAGDTKWHTEMLSNLKAPKSPVSWLHAIGWRIRRNYLWLYSGLLIAWIIKLDFVEGQAASFTEVVTRAGIGRLPGWMVVLAVGIFYLILAILALAAGGHELDED
ncbi:MAG: DUF2270 domain-containing protein [Trueperaceae bacterium]|nr:DUF2270 domain-containing protein [Trueperaceae bacterium]